MGSQPHMTLQMNNVVQHLHFWRLFTHNFVFTTPGELLFGMVLIYYFRQFERQLGSSRFAAFAIITAIIYTTILASLQVLLPSLSPASGPYSLVFASLVFFFFETPKLYRFEVLGAVEFSDKAFVYLMAMQLMISSPLRSLISFGAALFSGIVYRIPLIRDNADLPDFLVSFCSRYVLPLLGTDRLLTPRARFRRGDDHASAHHRRLGAAADPPRQTTTPQSETSLDVLVSMGFSEQQAATALERSHHDLQRATELLLSEAG